MNRDPYLPLTETVYYTLVALLDPCHGYKILNKVKELSEGQVHLAPGTLYGALENLEKQGLISLVEEVGPRKKVFQITEKGLDILKKDGLRLIHMSNILREKVKESPLRETTSDNKKSTQQEIQRGNFKDNPKDNPKDNSKEQRTNSKPINRDKVKKKSKEEELFY